jgi:hypothetical protein
MGKWGKKAHGEMTAAKRKIAVKSTQKWQRTRYSHAFNQYGVHSHATDINMDAGMQVIKSGQQE